MKKFLLASLAVATAASAAYGQAQRKVFFEQFTQASCPPCATANPDFDALWSDAANDGKTVVIKHQTSWPGYDPMYEQAPDASETRVSYYGVSGVPTLYMDGNEPTGVTFPVLASQANIDANYAVTSPIELTLMSDLTADGSGVDIYVKVKNVSASAFTGDRLHIALLEKEIAFTAAPGSNGETDFNHVVRGMYPDAGGTTLASIAAGDSMEYNFTMAVPGYIYELEDMAVAAFVQTDASREVHNAELSDVMMPVNYSAIDVSATASTAAPGLCDDMVTPEVMITNAGTVDVASFDVSYTINGGTPVVQSVATALTVGGSTTVTFPAASISAGATDIVYSVYNFDAGNAIDIFPNNNWFPGTTYTTVSAAAVGTDIQEGFEGATFGSDPVSRDVDDVIFISDAADGISYGVIDGPNGLGNAAGGFGNSDMSVWFRFFALQNSEVMDVVFDKRDLSAMTNPQLTFSHAHCMYDNGNYGPNDRLEVLVSSDCGANWTSVWDKQGANLATLPNNTSQFYVSGDAAEWAADTADLAAFAGEAEVLVMFRATSGYGNNLYIDDVNLAEMIVGVTETPLNAEVSIMPNPVRDNLTLQFDVEDNTDMDITIYNTLGQQVSVIGSGNYSGLNTIQVNTSELAAGVYQIHMVSDKGTLTKRFVVEK